MLCFAMLSSTTAVELSLLAYVARDGRRPTSMGLSRGENQEVLEREARTANSACSAALCMCVSVLEWSSRRPQARQTGTANY